MLCMDLVPKDFPAYQVRSGPQRLQNRFVLCYTCPRSTISQLLKGKQASAFIK